MQVTGRDAGSRECRAQVTPVTSCPARQLSECHYSRCERVPRIRGPAESGPGSRRPGPRHCRGAALASLCVASGRRPGRPPPNPGAKFRFLRGFRVHPSDSADPALRPRAAGGRGGARALSPGPSDVPGGPTSGWTPRGEVLDSLFEPKSTQLWEGARPGLIADGNRQTGGPLPGP
ncbi:unnamed protein product [Rangifer tarandus platyrhynchus]|uniref:Uncharacterized protein n=2 Tax=Rangifer tarandus platyrhynchus TaxID=3082113 RepID=A0ABN8YT19_RANTA|nr:unnamed protein product [Rangifer tarandus platyrhynchus]CAI9700548.1 unnamed protein product [Rangifer tarandus platyrhynchus]